MAVVDEDLAVVTGLHQRCQQFCAVTGHCVCGCLQPKQERKKDEEDRSSHGAAVEVPSPMNQGSRENKEIRPAPALWHGGTNAGLLHKKRFQWQWSELSSNVQPSC